MITGQVTNDELLGIYFANFCIESKTSVKSNYLSNVTALQNIKKNHLEQPLI
jgi:hypothetical protein